MIHNISRYLLTLVALFAMTTGAWADNTVYTSGQSVRIVDLKVGDIILPGATVTRDGMSTPSIQRLKFRRCTTEWVDMSESLPVTFDENAGLGDYHVGGKPLQPIDENGNVGNAWQVAVLTLEPFGYIATLDGITYRDPNAPVINEDGTEAEFEMPGNDVTVDYELVRDMAVGFSFKVGSEGQDGFTIRVKKDGESYVPSEMTMQEMIALITATDNLDAENPVTLTNKVDYTVEIFAADADGKPTGEAVAFNQLVPGTTYVAVATGIGAYDGTALSNTFLMTEAYDLTLSPATDANLKSVTVGDEAVTPTDGVIKNIEPAKKVKITTTGPDYIIRKATVKKTGAATPEGPTLAQTLTTANMTVKVYYIYTDMNNTCEFLSNGDGTYTFQSGTGLVGGNNQKAKALVVENGKLVFKQNFYETLSKLWNQVGFSVTFDTSENTYSIWKGSNETINATLSKVEVNGTQIALTQQ